MPEHGIPDVADARRRSQSEHHSHSLIQLRPVVHGHEESCAPQGIGYVSDLRATRFLQDVRHHGGNVVPAHIVKPARIPTSKQLRKFSAGTGFHVKVSRVVPKLRLACV